MNGYTYCNKWRASIMAISTPTDLSEPLREFFGTLAIFESAKGRSAPVKRKLGVPTAVVYQRFLLPGVVEHLAETVLDQTSRCALIREASAMLVYRSAKYEPSAIWVEEQLVQQSTFPDTEKLYDHAAYITFPSMYADPLRPSLFLCLTAPKEGTLFQPPNYPESAIRIFPGDAILVSLAADEIFDLSPHGSASYLQLYGDEELNPTSARQMLDPQPNIDRHEEYAPASYLQPAPSKATQSKPSGPSKKEKAETRKALRKEIAAEVARQLPAVGRKERAMVRTLRKAEQTIDLLKRQLQGLGGGQAPARITKKQKGPKKSKKAKGEASADRPPDQKTKKQRRAEREGGWAEPTKAQRKRERARLRRGGGTAAGGGGADVGAKFEGQGSAPRERAAAKPSKKRKRQGESDEGAGPAVRVKQERTEVKRERA